MMLVMSFYLVDVFFPHCNVSYQAHSVTAALRGMTREISQHSPWMD